MKKIVSKITAECPCTKAKANTAAVLGEVRNLPIPNQMNLTLYVDVMELPRFAGHQFALLVTDGLCRYSQVSPLTIKMERSTEGGLSKVGFKSTHYPKFSTAIKTSGLPALLVRTEAS